MSFSFTYPYPAPSTKGWGSGWPDCQWDKIVPHDLFVGGLREEIVELVNRLKLECERRGFKFVNPGCWGMGCRAKKTSSGSQGDEPSVHSWGLAIDVNAPKNVFGSDEDESEIATKFRWLPRLMEDYGFYWLGPPIRDWMHFHFAGSPGDAVEMTEKARKNLPTEDEMGFQEWEEGTAAYRAGEALDEAWSGDKKKGWRFARWAGNNPSPADVKPHAHTVSGFTDEASG